ncbi:acyl carrier protein [Kordia sp.]|uniref:acyl carrier protein n=1 Tax=Kordia sp. TaxID=1965332 RepID=UPI003D26F979
MKNLKNDFIEFSRKTLEIDTIEADVSFMEMGLNSIQIIKYINQINQDYNQSLTIVDLMENDTLEKLFQKIKENE